MKKQKRNRGDVVKITLENDEYAFAQILKAPLFAFYDLFRTELPSVDEIVNAPILFEVWVRDRAVTSGIWPVIGSAKVMADEAPRFFKRDRISGKLAITYTGAEEESATVEECRGLECAAVWEPEHIVDRLNDLRAGRPNKWVESLKVKAKPKEP